jgi:hypothetical protein
MSGEWWSIMTIAGPIALLVTLLWAVRHNRQSPREEARTEQATRDLRQEIQAEDRRLDGS